MPILKVIIVIQPVATHQLPVNIVMPPVATHLLDLLAPVPMPLVPTHPPPVPMVLPRLVTSILKVTIVMIMVATLQLLPLPLLVTIILKVIIVMLLVVTLPLPLPLEPELEPELPPEPTVPLPGSITLTISVIHAVTMVAPAYPEIDTGFTTTIATNGHAGTILLLLVPQLLVSTMQKVIIVILPLPVVTHLPTPPILASSIT
jgi:hypothetical protein